MFNCGTSTACRSGGGKIGHAGGVGGVGGGEVATQVASRTAVDALLQSNPRCASTVIPNVGFHSNEARRGDPHAIPSTVLLRPLLECDLTASTVDAPTAGGAQGQMCAAGPLWRGPVASKSSLAALAVPPRALPSPPVPPSSLLLRSRCGSPALSRRVRALCFAGTFASAIASSAGILESGVRVSWS
ncbi:unnamed protein product [Prorocentrum cordatum]|uniref:Subtilisin n=1 Tax=Prorocentrum cordatum TaxID=2364126 RepID=A0ABN9S1T0_9DINO|nr:unnamed protein product [Polarella glacialis]